MAVIINDKTTGGKWLVRANGGEWKFDTHAEAQKKANEEMWREFNEKQAVVAPEKEINQP